MSNVAPLSIPVLNLKRGSVNHDWGVKKGCDISDSAPVAMFPTSPLVDSVEPGLVVPMLPGRLAGIAVIKPKRTKRPMLMTKQTANRMQMAALEMDKVLEWERGQVEDHQGDVLMGYDEKREVYREYLVGHVRKLFALYPGSKLAKDVKKHVKGGSIKLPKEAGVSSPRTGPGALLNWTPPALPECLLALVLPEFRVKMAANPAQMCPLCSCCASRTPSPLSLPSDCSPRSDSSSDAGLTASVPTSTRSTPCTDLTF